MSLLSRRTGIHHVLSALVPLTLVGFGASGAGCSSAPPEQGAPPAENVAAGAQALTGIEGTLEYSLDAPWRMEPRPPSIVINRVTYGAIPIQMTIDDAIEIADDHDGYAAPTIAQACELTVTDGATTTVIPVAKFTEIERTRGVWTYPGDEQPNGPPRDVCTATSTSDCSSLASVAGTSEWHALAMYTPQSYGPGVDVPLTLQLRVMRAGQSCTDTDITHSYRMINHVRVHYGEAPLPKFDGGGWAYGDLHYHSQGTDNEGESGYNYRGVTRAMEAIGLDFVFATDHASASNQIIDADITLDKHLTSLKSAQMEAVVRRGVLRDMDARRFRALGGAVADTNRQTALRAKSVVNPRFFGTPRTPQIFLGGEVDVIPELQGQPAQYTWGDDRTWPVSNLCGGWHGDAMSGTSVGCDDGVFRCADVSLIDGKLGIDISACDPTQLWSPLPNGEMLLRDVQAVNEFDFGREHMVYLPDPNEVDPFVGSFTGVYGGASRRLVDQFTTPDGVPREGMLPEVERKHGSVFLAHHMNGAGGPGTEGPDGAPWSASMLDKAFRSHAVLGLEFWNEDGRRTTNINTPSGHFDDGYNRSVDYKMTLNDFTHYAFRPDSNGKLELIPFDLDTGRFDYWTRAIDAMLTNGAVSWDRLNLKGLDPNQTKDLAWLPAGQPRKLFMAGGSDAHGDFNYRRTGYMVQNDTVIDMAIGTPRNLVMAGAPRGSVDPTAPAVLSQGQTLSALRAGHFAVTDGPAIRIAIDTNGNGVIDDTDVPMGDTYVAGWRQGQLPVLVEWASTAEWGALDRIELTVGALDSATGKERIYAGGMGPAGSFMASPATDSYLSKDGTIKYTHTSNDYWFLDNPNPPIDWVPGELSTMLSTQLAGVPSDIAGVRSYTIDIGRLMVDSNGTAGDRLFIRAVGLGHAAGQPGDCEYSSSDAGRLGKCTRRFAFTNPIWVLKQKLPIVVGPLPPVSISTGLE
jgi:hypothetical protein